VAKYCPKRYQAECVSQTAQIMYAASATLAAKRFRAWKQRWQDKIPKVVNGLEKDFDKLRPIFEFPEEIRRIIRTTDVTEHCFREVRRRLKVRGCFQNSKSCDRIIYAIFAYHNVKGKRNTEKIKAIKNVTDQAA
jgi:putative transposase